MTIIIPSSLSWSGTWSTTTPWIMAAGSVPLSFTFSIIPIITVRIPVTISAPTIMIPCSFTTPSSIPATFPITFPALLFWSAEKSTYESTTKQIKKNTRKDNIMPPTSQLLLAEEILLLASTMWINSLPSKFFWCLPFIVSLILGNRVPSK